MTDRFGHLLTLKKTFFFPGLTPMEKKLAEYKCNTNEAIQLKLGNAIFKILTK